MGLSVFFDLCMRRHMRRCGFPQGFNIAMMFALGKLTILVAFFAVLMNCRLAFINRRWHEIVIVPSHLEIPTARGFWTLVGSYKHFIDDRLPVG